MLRQRSVRMRVGFLLLASIIVVTLGIVGVATVVLPALHVNAAGSGFNNEGISPQDGVSNSASFDGHGYSYSNVALHNAGFTSGSHVTVNGTSFQWPTVSGGVPDNWLANGQSLPVSVSTSTLGFLGASNNGVGSGTLTLTYSDNSTQNVTLAFSDWALPNGSGLLPGESIAATTPYRNTSSGGQQHFNIYVFYTSVALASGKTLVSVTLPSSTSPGHLHVFAVQGFIPSSPVNNEGIAAQDGVHNTASFDGHGYSYSNTSLGNAGFGSGSKVTFNGITFQWPTVSAGVPDNWRAAGQVIPVALGGTGGTLGFLGAGSNGMASGTLTLTYSDNSTQNVTLAFSDWALPNGSAGLLPGESVAAASRYRDTASGGEQHFNVYVFYTSVPLASGKRLVSITLPGSTSPGQLHVFAVQGAAAPTSTPTPTPSPTPTQPSTSPDWTTYLGNPGHTGFNSNETVLTASNFANLQLKWKLQAGTAGGATGISIQPVETNGIVYWGSWDGTFHATSVSTGHDVWSANVGQFHAAQCNPPTVGVAGTATVATINGTPTVFVGGGNRSFYAFNAATGAQLWSTYLGNNNHPSNGADFIWSSANIYNGNVYIGLSSFDDCPLVQGQLIEMSASGGQIENTFNAAPNGCVGNSVTSSPTIDTATGIIYIATGNPDPACGAVEPYGSAVVALDANTFSVLGSWQIPNAYTTDFDFLNTATLFTATIGGTPKQLVGIANKNGIYYAFDRSNISAGPIWQAQIATTNTSACPQCGNGSISPSVWDGTTLYVAGGNVVINGNSCLGSVNAINPANGAFLWRQCTNNGHVLGALMGINGVVVDSEGTQVVARNASTGNVIFHYTDTNSGALFYGAPSIADDRLYVGSMDGLLFSFGL